MAATELNFIPPPDPYPLEPCIIIVPDDSKLPNKIPKYSGTIRLKIRENPNEGSKLPNLDDIIMRLTMKLQTQVSVLVPNIKFELDDDIITWYIPAAVTLAYFTVAKQHLLSAAYLWLVFVLPEEINVYLA